MTPFRKLIRKASLVVGDTWDCDNCYIEPGEWCDYHKTGFDEAMDHLWNYTDERDGMTYVQRLQSDNP